MVNLRQMCLELILTTVTTSHWIDQNIERNWRVLQMTQLPMQAIALVIFLELAFYRKVNKDKREKTMIELSVFKQALEKLAELLDISDSAYDRIEKSYETLGEWLGRDESSVKDDQPEIYTQGSFRLGTVIRPISDKDDYDIDLVCQLNSPELTIDSISQKHLKEKIGEEIKLYAKSKGMQPPEEKKKCWGLNYRDPKYHIDALPALPNRTIKISATRISITNNTKPYYARVHSDWDSGDPKGYSEWFKKRMETQFDAVRLKMASNARANVEEIPEYRVKTPLQRAIQVLKRHRDIMFQNNSGNKPVSIIITTLAAHAYKNETDLYDAITTIVNNMAQHITTKNGEDWVENPVNSSENFADKWSKNKTLRNNFHSWLTEAKTIFATMRQSKDIEEMITVMGAAFGEVTANKVDSYFSQSEDVKSTPLIIESAATNRPKPWKK